MTTMTDRGTAPDVPIPEVLNKTVWQVQSGPFETLRFITDSPVSELLNALYSVPGKEKVTVAWSALVEGTNGSVARLAPLGHATGYLNVARLVRMAFNEIRNLSVSEPLE